MTCSIAGHPPCPHVAVTLSGQHTDWVLVDRTKCRGLSHDTKIRMKGTMDLALKRVTVLVLCILMGKFSLFLQAVNNNSFLNKQHLVFCTKQPVLNNYLYTTCFNHAIILDF
jgi:hypothetical protein